MAIPPLHPPVKKITRTDVETEQEEKVAVALGFEPGKDPAPKVVAKGQGELADRIIEVALESGVEIREDKDLVMILSELELDTVIPVEVYEAVAQILSYVYKVNADKRDKMS